MKKISALVIRFRIPIIVFISITTLVLGYFLKDIRINADILSYLPNDDPVTQLNTYVSEKYGGSQMAIVGVEAEDIFNRRVLENIHTLTSEFCLIDGVRYVTSLTNLLDIKKVEGWLEIGRLIDPERLPESDEELKALKEYTLNNDMFRGRLVSEDGKATIIVCRLTEDSDKAFIAGQIKDIVTAADLSEKVCYAGLPFQLIEISQIVNDDILKLIPLSALLIILALFLSFRSIRGVVLLLLSAGISIVWSLGIMSLLNISFSVISNVIPVVLIAVGSAYSIHVISMFNEEEESEDSRTGISVQALQKVALPVILAGLTTISGFIAFVFGSYLTMIRDFGIFSSLGIFFALILSLTLVPAVLSLLPEPKSLKKRKGSTWEPLTRWFAALIEKHSRAVSAVGVVLIIVSIFGMPRIKTEVDILSYFKNGTDIRLSEEMMREKFGGSTTLQLLVKGNIMDPTVLKKMKEAEDFLKSRPGLNNVQSIVELIEEMSYAIVDERSIPETEEQVANLWFLLEGEEILSQLVSENLDEAVIQATIESQDTGEMSELVRVIESYISGVETEDCSFQLAGSLKIYDLVDRGIRKSLVQSLLIALCFVFLCNILLLRSFKGGLIGLIPIVFTLFVLFGAMGLSGAPLDVATVLIGSISMGVGIDYSIHFLSRFRREYQKGRDRNAALAGVLTTTGEAIFINMITVAAGFLALLLGNLIPLQRFSLLITSTMICSGLGALILLPSIMVISPSGLFKGIVENVFLLKMRNQKQSLRKNKE